jgi:RNA polymerase sigma-70 factor (ECF subfamily)
MSDAPTNWMEQLEALGRGDRAALARLRRLVTGHLIRLGAYDRRDAWDDVAQEVLIRLWNAYRDEKIRDPKAFAGFSRTVTRNVLVDTLRRHRRADSDPMDEEFERRVAAEETGPDPGTRIALRDALAKLPERHREVIERIYLRGLTYDETARELDRPRGTVNRLQREAMQTLREILAGGDEVAI